MFEDLKRFPWKDAILGFIIPKIILLIGISKGLILAGGSAAMLWCICVFWYGHVRAKKVNIFAILAVVMIIARIIVVMASQNPAFYLIVQALDNASLGAMFLVTLLMKRSFVQLFVEESGITVPAHIKNSPYYSRAWRILTAMWGASCFAFAVILVLLKIGDLKLVAQIDLFGGWALSLILVIMTVRFPRWYWNIKLAGAAIP